MAKMVGLSRNLKLQWLNRVVELVLEDLTEQEIKDRLNEYLSFEIESPTNIRKTREILMNIWVYENEQANKIKMSALELIKTYPEYDLVIHWCMMMVAYPVFVDMCKLIGKMAEFQDEITLAQLKQKLFDEWGERTTLFHSIDKLVATLKALNVIVCDKPGKYHINTHRVSNPKVISLMVYTMMIVDDSGYYTLNDINSSAYLFPFDYKIEKETLFEDSRFAMNNFGGELSISLND
ncbi:MAG: hypothetical protein PUG48_01465 [Clostridia bacterium]|nr:hypothetical protein [Clostridia bacterium]